MVSIDRIFPMVVLGSIVAFAIIHLGVSIGIIVPFRKYGDIFTPQIGLSAFNIVVSFLGLLTGILGVIAAWLSSKRFGTIVCFISFALGIFALASLITAIILNSKSLNYVSSHFSNNLISYKNSANARDKIDRLQIKYQCCGTYMWIDWGRAELNQTTSVSNVTSTTMGTTTPSITTTSTVSTSVTTTSASGSRNVKRDIVGTSNNIHRRQLLLLADYSRRKRQAPATYGGIENLPITFGVVLPKSCCTSEALLTSNGSDAYCVSNANNAVNHFYVDGCTKPIDKTAGNQFMGFGVINSFMVVLAFIAIPVLLRDQPTD